MNTENINDLSLTLNKGSLFEKCEELGKILQLEQPVEEQVLLAALENEVYASNLLISKGNLDFLNLLLAKPPAPKKKASNKATAHSQVDLIKKAGKSLYNWAQTGFQKVPWEILEKREAACLGCPNLIEPKHRLQKMTASADVRDETGKRTGNKVCQVCGCVVKNKMKVATDTCPQEDPNRSGYNRWGDMMRN